jgi:hypothetical protein
MAFTKEQWQVLEVQLSHPFGRIKLKCDGYEIEAIVERGKGLKLVIMVYIDGWFKGEWMDGKDERCLKFYREKRSYLYSSKTRAKAKEMLCKRIPKDMREHYQRLNDKSFTWYTPYWPSANMFFRHIRKTCKEIELMDPYSSGSIED